MRSHLRTSAPFRTPLRTAAPCCAPLRLVAPHSAPAPPDPSASAPYPLRPRRYETQTEGTFKSAAQVKDKKGIYTAIVGGLVVVAFVAPMVQFWFYTGGD